MKGPVKIHVRSSAAANTSDSTLSGFWNGQRSAAPRIGNNKIGKFGKDLAASSIQQQHVRLGLFQAGISCPISLTLRAAKYLGALLLEYDSSGVEDRQPMIDQAFAFLQAGISILPVRPDGSKRPALIQWQHYQRALAGPREVEIWFRNGEGLGVIGGAISGNLEILDFDNVEIYHAYKEMALATGLGDLIARIEHGYSEQTPRGMHWLYRCDVVSGNTPLARKVTVSEKRKQISTLIEIRGEGGYAIVAPSNGTVHPSGLPYVLRSGSAQTIATISPQERSELHRLARTFDETIKPHDAQAGQQARKGGNIGDRPGDDFNARATWPCVLEPHGWTLVYTRGAVAYWRRPGKTEGISATTNFADSDLLYVFSTSTDFESERGYSQFSAYALLNHQNDFTAAARALQQQGYGKRASEESATIEVTEDEENARMLELEREDPTEPLSNYPCPPVLWRGRFAQVADLLGKRTWEVWVGILAALGARAHKNIHFSYHRPLYGMVYTLCVNPTGLGKGICTDVCHALLPAWYTVRDAVQSGPALAPILAEIERNAKGRVERVTSRPAILLLEEWTTLLKNSKIEHSTLAETLNTLFHRTRSWNVSRSDRSGAGGDLLIENPILSICATTTASLLREQVSDHMIRSGFLNRYLVLPGSRGTWRFCDEQAAGISVGVLKRAFDDIQNRAWGGGANVWDGYTAEAKERLISWGETFFESLMQSDAIEAEAMKRLHVYSHIVPHLTAWSEQQEKASLPHVEVAIAAITTSHAFLQDLMRSNTDVEIPRFKQYEMQLEQKVIEKVRREPGITQKKVAQDLRKSASYRDVSGTVRRLLTGHILEHREGQGNTLWVVDERRK